MKKSELIPYHPKCPPPGWKCPKKFKLGLGSPWESSDSEDNGDSELFLLASQQYKEQARRTLMEEETNKCDEDELLLMASQQYEEQAGKNQMEKKAKESVNDYPAMTTNSQFGSPKSNAQVKETRKSGVPAKTRGQNVWASSLWRDWLCIERACHQLRRKKSKMSLKKISQQ